MAPHCYVATWRHQTTMNFDWWGQMRACMHQQTNLDIKFHGANMGPTWGRQDPDEPHVGPMNFAIWEFWLIVNWIWEQSSQKFENIICKMAGSLSQPNLVHMNTNTNTWIFINIHFY